MRNMLICIGVVILLSGCGPTSSSYPSNAGLPYPGSAGSRVSAGTSPSIVVPTPVPTKATLTGRIYNSITGQPIVGIMLYLATLLPLTPGPDFFLNLDPANSPHILLPEDGGFVIANVVPGKYALVLWTPRRASHIPDLNDPNQALIVELIAGQITDLGNVAATPP